MGLTLKVLKFFKENLILILSLFLTFFVYYPSLNYDFIHSLDDDWLIVNNPSIKDLSWKGIKHLFFNKCVFYFKFYIRFHIRTKKICAF